MLFLLEFSFSFLHTKRSDVLGVRTDIAVTDLLMLTNQKRAENGLAPLVLNTELTEAATEKSADMFAKNYWAHNSPDGTTPWVFIKSTGYDYLYAGENLARGFTNSADVIDAWMKSPGHRENMLSPNYKDIGFSIQSGALTGDQTILVVEEFGQQREGASDVVDAGRDGSLARSQVPNVSTEKEIVPAESPSVASFKTTPLIDVKEVTKGIGLVVLGVFFFTLLFDVMIAERKKIVRIVAHNIDTMLFILVVIATILLVGNGIIV